MDHETDRHPARRRRKPSEPDQGGCTGAVAGAACTPVPQTGMTQFYATSFMSAWHFLRERWWVRPKASFDKLFLAAGGSTARTAIFCQYVSETKRKCGRRW